MNGTAARLVGVGVGLLGLVTLGSILIGHADEPDAMGMPTDWSHQHLIFSRPATPEMENRVAADPRYWQQWGRRNVARMVSEDGWFPTNGVSLELGGPVGLHSQKVHRDWSEDLGSGASVGAGNYPAKYSFQIKTANCGSAAKPDYVVFSTGLLGSGSQPSIVAFDNLYSGCGGTVPTVYWAFDTGGQVLTSPTISGDGTQVAFVQTNGGGIGTLVLLKWAAGSGTLGSPTTLTAVGNSSYRACTAPCMTTVVLRDSGGTAMNDTTSSVFPDYSGDVIWVGGASSWLHKISGVFRGTPAEVTTGGFPDHLNPGNPNTLSSPVYDSVSGNVYVGDYGGFLYRVSSTGVVTKSGQLDYGTGVVAAPIVDSTLGKVYVFASTDNSTACTGGAPCAAVYLLANSFAAGTRGAKVTVGTSVAFPGTPNPLYEGGLDSEYFASVTRTGNLYVCGNTAGAPTLYRIQINAGALGTVVTGPALSSATTGCSPVSDVSNPNAVGGVSEWIFASAQASGLGNNCASGGCIMNFKDQPWLPATAYSVGQQILDTHFQIQVVRVAGTSRTAAQGHPGWATTIGGNTTDNTVRWTNAGPLVPADATWQASHVYTVDTEIVDNNGNIEFVSTAGTSKAGTHPTWSTTIGGVTADNNVRWRNVGAIATSSLAAAGGASGVVMDNTVGSGTLAGASQVYFSTRTNQTCATSGGSGGCAVQASQSALQ